MACRAEKLRRRQHRKDKKHKQLRRSQPTLPPDTAIIETPPGALKLSEALLTLVEPERNQCLDDASLRKLLTIGMAAWNAALVQGVQRTELVEQLAQTFPGDVQAGFKAVMDALVRRKEQLFPEIRRPILEFRLTWPTAHDPYLQVIAALSDLQ